MAARLLIYFRHTVKPMGLSILCLSICLGMHMLYHTIYFRKGSLLTPYFILGVSTYFFLLLFWRITDEFKDYEVDRQFFPNRPVPSGKVKLIDLKILTGFVVTILLVSNILWPIAFIPFLVVFVYAILMSRWFFMKKQISNNRFLAVITHIPTILLLNIYVLAIVANYNGYEILHWVTFVVAIWFTLPFLAWEFAKKTWSPCEEMDGYQTYSKMIGYTYSAIISFSFCVLQTGVSIFLYWFFKLSWIFLVLPICVWLGYLYFTLSFILNPEKYANKFRVYSFYYVLIVYIITVIGSYLTRR